MIVKKLDKNVTLRQFNSITELVEFNHGKVKDCFKERFKSSCGTYDFTKTKSYEEAEELLLHGWEEMAKRLNTKLQRMNVSKQTKQKTVYDVCGYQCSVPRYLQGIPTNMINKQTIKQKQKVLNIYKSISYSCNVSTETIINESVKVLHCVNELEKQGYRINLFVIFAVQSKYRNNIILVKIKDASQKMNVKQIAFPLVHPSMLRRMIFRVIEIADEYDDRFVYGYGKIFDIRDYGNIVKYLKDSYFIPKVVNENEITDIEKYRV